MKTPKRKFKFPMDSLNGLGTRLAFEAEEVPTAHSLLCERWKRKNRIAQLKRTIAKQAEEIYHLRKLVELKLATEYAESEKQALRWAQENIVIRTFAPNLTCEEIDGKLMLCNVAPRPQITFK